MDKLIEEVRRNKNGNKLAEQGASLLSHLLQVAPRKRFDISSAIGHAFLKGGNTVTMDERALQGLKQDVLGVGSKVDILITKVNSIQERTLILEDLPETLRKGFLAIGSKLNSIRKVVVQVGCQAGTVEMDS